MSRQYDGRDIAMGHAPLMRMLLDEADHDTVIESRGDQFYNASDFPLLTLVMRMLALRTSWTCPDMAELKQGWNRHRSEVSLDKKIVIGVTPMEVSSEYLAILDGGLIHEVLHSLYTVRGHWLDLKRLHKLLEANWDASVQYRSKMPLFKSLWNIYEDAMIERHGLKRWPATREKLERTHMSVWELEEPGRLQGGFSLTDHVCCYLRDVIQEWSDRAPLETYDPKARHIVDDLLSKEVRDSDAAMDSYDTLALTLRTLSILTNLPTTKPEPEPEPKPDQSSRKKKKNEESEEPSDPGFELPGDGGEGEESGEESDEESDEGGEGEAGEGGESGEEGGEGNSSKMDAGGEEESQEGEESGENAGESSGASESPSADDSRRDPEEESLLSQKDVDEMASATKTRALETSDALETHTVNGSDLRNARCPRPLEPGRDLRFVIKPDSRYRKLLDKKKAQLEPFVTTLRSQLALFLRGEAKVRRLRHLQKGRRLSNRSLSTLVTSRNPKPFEDRVNTQARTTAVQVVLDLSGSMKSDTPTNLLMIFGMLLGDLGVPWSAIGFQGTPYEYRNPGGYHAPDRTRFSSHVTRTEPVQFPLFHDFEDSNGPDDLTRLLQHRASGGTPFMDGFWEGVQRIKARPEKRRLLVLITDGDTSPGSLTKLAAHKVLRAMHEDIRKEGVEVLVVGYQHNVRYLPQEDVISVRDPHSFAEAFQSWLLERLKK